MKNQKTNEEILAILSKRIEELGRRLTLDDIKTDKDLKPHDIRRRFGSLAKANELASFRRSHVKSQEEELLDTILKVIDSYGRMLSRIEVDHHPDLKGSAAYIKAFGNWPNLVRRINKKRPGFDARKLNKDCLIVSLKLKAAEAPDHPITRHSIFGDPRMPVCGVYDRLFGSLDKALSAAGLSIPEKRQYGKKATSRAKAIADLKHKAEALGRAPTSTEVSKDENLMSSTTYMRVLECESWADVLALIGYDSKSKYWRRNVSQAEKKAVAIQELQTYAKIIGHTPTSIDLVTPTQYTRSASYYSALFGTFGAALKAAGLEPNPRKNQSKGPA